MLSTKDDDTAIAVDEFLASDPTPSALGGKASGSSKLRRWCTKFLNRET